MAYMVEREMFNLCLADVLSPRFQKVFKEKKVDVDKLGKTMGTGWFTNRHKVKVFPDGTSKSWPRNRLKEFVDGETLYLPKKALLLQLEKALDCEPCEILTCYVDNMSLSAFLMSLGFLNIDGQPTEKMLRSSRVRRWQAHLDELEAGRTRALAAASDAAAAIAQRKAFKERQETWLKRVKKFAVGQWGGTENG